MLNGKVAIVTGASSGIGEALSIQLASKGARVVLAARRKERLDAIATRVHGTFPSALPVVTAQCDVTDRTQAEDLVARAISQFGRLDILVNNAGRGHLASIEETTDEVLWNMFAVNVFSLWYTTRPALRQMRSQQSGHIINIASIAGKLGFPLNSAYVAAKHAVVGFTRALRLELAETGVHASVVCPAAVLTEWANVTEGGSMGSLFMESGPLADRNAAERNVEPPHIESVLSAYDIAAKIVDCIRHPVAELYTHRGTHEFVVESARDPESAERRQIPAALAERSVYERLQKRG